MMKSRFQEYGMECEEEYEMGKNRKECDKVCKSILKSFDTK